MSESSRTERRARNRTAAGKWLTALTRIEPNAIQVRGYPVDEMMGRLSFAEAVYLLLVGELPPPAIGKLLSAILVSSVDHGATPPSTIVARNVATAGAPLRNAVAAGLMALGEHHGADIGDCLRFLDHGLELVRGGKSYESAAEVTVRRLLDAGRRPPGFGHRIHTRDPRTVRLMNLAMELELDGEHVRFIQSLERVLARTGGPGGEPMPMTVDGAIAAVCGDLGLDADIADALFIIARVPGLIAHAHEERHRQHPMREIDPKDHEYDGPRRRRLPETRR